jgi:hypothetical protein
MEKISLVSPDRARLGLTIEGFKFVSRARDGAEAIATLEQELPKVFRGTDAARQLAAHSDNSNRGAGLAVGAWFGQGADKQ